MLMAGRMHPPFLFCRAKRETGRARSKEKSVGALRCSGPPRDGGRRIGASADLARPSGTLYSSAISPTAVPWRIVRRSSGWSSHGAASLFAAASCPARELPIKASAPTTARAARSEAERAGVGIRRFRFPPAYPPQLLCGYRALQTPESGAGPTGPSMRAGPIRTTPAFTRGRPSGPASCPGGFLLTGRGRFLLSRQKKMGANPSQGACTPHPACRENAFCESLKQTCPLPCPVRGQPPSPRGRAFSKSADVSRPTRKKGERPGGRSPCLFAFLRNPRCPRSGDAVPRPGCC